MTNKWIKTIGMITTVIGCGATILSYWIDDQKMAMEIEEKVNAAFAEREHKEEES